MLLNTSCSCVCMQMGIKELLPLLKAHFPEHFSCGVLPPCAVDVREAEVDVFKYASTDESMSLIGLVRLLARPYEYACADARCRLLVVTADVAKYVPSQKKNEQKKRSLARVYDAYPGDAALVPAIEETETITEEKNADGLPAYSRTFTTTEGGINFSELHKTSDKDPGVIVPMYYPNVVPRKLISTRGMRKKLVGQMLLYIKSTIWSWPAHSSVIIDGGTRTTKTLAVSALGDPTMRTEVVDCVEWVRPHRHMHSQQLANMIGEGEIKAFHWIVLAAAVPEYKHGPFVVSTRDTDFLALCVLQLWERLESERKLLAAIAVETKRDGHSESWRAQECALELETVRFPTLYWRYRSEYRNDHFVEVKPFIEELCVEGWKKYTYTVGCALLGTDYSTKDLTTRQIGSNVLWATWCTHQRKIVETIKRCALAELLASGIKPAAVSAAVPDPETVLIEAHPTVLIRVTFEVMIKAAYAEKFGHPTPWDISWKKIGELCKAGKSKLATPFGRFNPPFPGTMNYATGLAEVRWTFDYWSSLGREQSDIIISRGEINLKSTLLTEKLGFDPNHGAPRAIVASVVVASSSDADADEVEDPEDDLEAANAVFQAVKSVHGHSTELFNKYVASLKPGESGADRTRYAAFLSAEFKSESGYMFAAKKRKVSESGAAAPKATRKKKPPALQLSPVDPDPDAIDWQSKKKTKYTGNDCVHPSKAAVATPSKAATVQR